MKQGHKRLTNRKRKIMHSEQCRSPQRVGPPQAHQRHTTRGQGTKLPLCSRAGVDTHAHASISHSGHPPGPSVLAVSRTDSVSRTVENPRRTKGDEHVVEPKGQHPSVTGYERVLTRRTRIFLLFFCLLRFSEHDPAPWALSDRLVPAAAGFFVVGAIS